MPPTITYVRYYFPNGLRWSLTVLLIPFVPYLLIIGWYITACFCLIIAFILWSCKYVLSIDQTQKLIKDEYFVMAIPQRETYAYNELQTLVVKKESKGYRAASRARDYSVHYLEYSLYLQYDDHKQLVLFTINDLELFKRLVERFSKELNLKVENFALR